MGVLRYVFDLPGAYTHGCLDRPSPHDGADADSGFWRAPTGFSPTAASRASARVKMHQEVPSIRERAVNATDCCSDG